MNTPFEILGYHKELFDKNTGKYIGHIKMTVPDRSEAKWGYFGRTLQDVKGTAHKAQKTFEVDGQYVTECIPVCGKIKADKLQDRHKILEDHYLKTSAMRSK